MTTYQDWSLVLDRFISPQMLIGREAINRQWDRCRPLNDNGPLSDPESDDGLKGDPNV